MFLSGVGLGMECAARDGGLRTVGVRHSHAVFADGLEVCSEDTSSGVTSTRVVDGEGCATDDALTDASRSESECHSIIENRVL